MAFDCLGFKRAYNLQIISKDNTTIANSFFASGNRYSTRFCFSISSQGDKKRRDFIRNITYVPKLDIFISSSEKGVVSQWSSKVQTVDQNVLEFDMFFFIL